MSKKIQVLHQQMLQTQKRFDMMQMWSNLLERRNHIVSYYFSKTLKIQFDGAVIKLTDELKKEGFGILITIKRKGGLINER